MKIRWKIVAVAFGLSVGMAVALASANSRPTSEQALRARFLTHHANFEKLVAMANEDNHLTRIAPDFTWLDDDVSWPRKYVGISEQRWNSYRQLFRSVGTTDGVIKRNSPIQIMFPITSGGVVPSGFSKGLVYSQEPLRPVVKSLDKRPPHELWDGPDRSHILVYKPIGNHWYMYYEQW